MKIGKIYKLYILAVVLLLFGCGQDAAVTEDTQVQDTERSTAAGELGAEQADTTLQEAEEITLRAIGNTMQEMAYDQDTLEVRAGAHVQLQLINEASDPSMIHNVVITEPGRYKLAALAGAKVGASGNYVPDSPIIIAASPLALPGQTVILEFTAPATPGSYDFVCTYPGHWQQMNGKLIVK